MASSPGSRISLLVLLAVASVSRAFVGPAWLISQHHKVKWGVRTLTCVKAVEVSTEQKIAGSYGADKIMVLEGLEPVRKR